MSEGLKSYLVSKQRQSGMPRNSEQLKELQDQVQIWKIENRRQRAPHLTRNEKRAVSYIEQRKIEKAKEMLTRTELYWEWYKKVGHVYGKDAESVYYGGFLLRIQRREKVCSTS